MTRTDFEQRYREDPDPFGVFSRWYERRKQAVVLASLGRERYRGAWDTACGTGALALALAPRCDHLLATDASARAVQLTAASTLPASVVTAVHRLPAPLPPGLSRPFDLCLLTEVLFYLSDADRAATADLVHRVSAASGAEVLAVNWRHHPDDADVAGEAAVAELGGTLTQRGWTPAVRHDEDDFVVYSWRR